MSVIAVKSLLDNLHEKLLTRAEIKAKQKPIMRRCIDIDLDMPYSNLPVKEYWITKHDCVPFTEIGKVKIRACSEDVCLKIHNTSIPSWVSETGTKLLNTITHLDWKFPCEINVSFLKYDTYPILKLGLCLSREAMDILSRLHQTNAEYLMYVEVNKTSFLFDLANVTEDELNDFVKTYGDSLSSLKKK